MKNIRIKEAFSLAINTTFISLLIFLMIEVIWAQTLKSLIIDRTNTPLLNFIIIFGFLISAIVSIISSLLTTNRELKRPALWSALIAFILNLFIWILISQILIEIRYPEVTENMNILEKFAAIPVILSYFAIYFLSNVTLLWIFSSVSYSILFALFVYLISKKKSNKNYAYKNWELG